MSEDTRPDNHRSTVVVGVIGAIATVVAALIAGIFSLLGQSPDTPASPPDTAGAGNAPTAAVQPTASAPNPATSTNDDQMLLFDGEVTLARQAAVDVDADTPTVVKEQVGATGNFDLYHDSGEVRSDNLRVHGGTLFGYPAGASTNSAEAFGICSDYTGSSPSYNSAIPSLGLTVGVPFCFVTSSNHLAWAMVEGIENTTMTAVVRVRVWDTVES